jgi:ribose/xylose/arabinose/galactoside ABC-type transport system permease subunit
MGTGIDLFLDWENGIWVAGTGIWPLGMGNEVLKNGNGIEVMWVNPFLVSLVMIFVVNYIIHSTTCEQAYSAARNSGFSDYACLRMLQMPFPGFKFKNSPPPNIS